MATRNVDPEVGQARSKIAVAVLMRDPEAERYWRRELAEAKILAAAKSLRAQLPDLPEEKRAQAIAIVGGAQ